MAGEELYDRRPARRLEVPDLTEAHAVEWVET